jgi:DUF971 family protein
MAGTRPTNITVDRSRKVLIIPWTDGHHSEYPLGLLREACPCAECRGGHANTPGTALARSAGASVGPPLDPASLVIPLAPAKSYGVRNLTLVGHYAMQIEWEDGHMFGIYTWDYLRALCPCPECTAERAREQPKDQE